MVCLSDILARRIKDQKVDLSFEGIITVNPMLNQDKVISLTPLEALSLSVRKSSEKLEYFLTTSGKEPYWTHIADVFCQDYQPELLAVAIAHLKSHKRPVQADLPNNLKNHVNADHLHFLNSKGQYAYMEQHMPGHIPIYRDENLVEVFDSMLL
mgnify:FL=1